MKNMILKTMGTMLAVLMLMVFTQISALAQDEISDSANTGEKVQEKDTAMWHNNAKKLEGVWSIQVTGRNCQTGDVVNTFPAMQTYMSGGTLQDFGTGNAPTLRSPGMGIWSYDFGRRYTTAFQFFLYYPDGTLAGKHVGRQEVQLSPSGDSYTAAGTGQIYDVNGNVTAIRCSTATATRFE